MKTLKSLAALSLGALCLAFNTQVIAKEAAPAKASQATQQVAKRVITSTNILPSILVIVKWWLTKMAKH